MPSNTRVPMAINANPNSNCQAAFASGATVSLAHFTYTVANAQLSAQPNESRTDAGTPLATSGQTNVPSPATQRKNAIFRAPVSRSPSIRRLSSVAQIGIE